MVVKINGKGEEIKEGSTIASVLSEKGVRIEMVAVEQNGQFVDKSLFDNIQISDGDEIEYLYYMGGGSNE